MASLSLKSGVDSSSASGIAASSSMTAADQQSINKFARIHTKSEKCKAEMAKKENELRNVSDAIDELLLLDDEITAKGVGSLMIYIKVGDCFVNYKNDEASEHLEKIKANVEDDIKSLKQDLLEMDTEMKALKVTLYGKFGKNINLEAEDSD